MRDMRDAGGQEGCSARGMQNRKVAVQEGCRTGGIQEIRDAIKEGQEGCRKGGE